MIDHFSVSSLKLHQRNPRRFCLQYVERIKEPEGGAALYGKIIHQAIEYKLKGHEGWDELLNNNEKELLEQWHEENASLLSNMRCEDRFRIWLAPDLPPIEGCIDLHDENNVYDVKTIGNKKYALTQKELMFDWQLSLYLYALNAGVFKDYLRPNQINIGHFQLFKNRLGGLDSYKTISTTVDWFDVVLNIDAIEQEMREALLTIRMYKQEGIEAIRATPENEIWYGRKDIMWEAICGRESVESLRKRIEENNING